MKTIEQIRECQIILWEEMNFLAKINISHEKFHNLFSSKAYFPPDWRWTQTMNDIMFELFCSRNNQFIIDTLLIRRIIKWNKDTWSLYSYLTSLKEYIEENDNIFFHEYFQNFNNDLETLNPKTNEQLNKILMLWDKTIFHLEAIHTPNNPGKARIKTYSYKTLEEVSRQIFEIFNKYVDIFQKYHIKHGISQFTTPNS